MNENLVEVKIRADASGFTAGAREAGGALSGLTDSLKEWRTHVRTEARYTQFMAAQVAGLGIASKGAAAEITGLVSAFAFGNTLGLAIESAKMLVKHFMEVSAETARTSELTKLYGADLKAMGEEGAKHVGSLKKSITDTLLAMRELRSETMLRRELEGPLKREKELKEEIAKFDEQIATGAASAAWTEAGRVTQDVSLLEGRKAKLEEELRKVQAEMAGISKAIAPLGADEKRDKREQEAKDIATWQADQIKEQKKYYDAQTELTLKAMKEDERLAWAKNKAEYDAMVALEKDKEHLDDVARKENERKEREEDRVMEERRQKVKALADHISSSVSGAINSIIDGTKSVGDAMVEMLKGMAKAIIAAFVKEVVEGIVAAVTGTALAKVAARKQVAAHTATAAAGSAAAMASVPFIGPILAHGAAAEMVSFLGGLTEPLLSAAGGLGRVPHDTLAMVHKDETVLPADLAEAYRQGAPGGGGGDGSITIVVNTVYADAEGMRKLPQDPDFQRGIREAMRNGRL